MTAPDKATAARLADDPRRFKIVDQLNWRDEVAAFLRTLAAQPDDAAAGDAVWRPIETALKDGSPMLLAKIVGHIEHPTALWWVAKGHWSAKWNNWNDGLEPSGLAGPTHWQPIQPLRVQP